MTQEHSRGLHTLHFHSNAQLMLVGGQDKKLNLFQVITIIVANIVVGITISI
jgi:hypothetical protein